MSVRMASIFFLMKTQSERYEIQGIIHWWWEWTNYSHSGKSLPVSYKVRHSITVGTSNCMPIYLSNWSENRHVKDYVSSILNWQKPNQPRYPSVGWIHRWCYVYMEYHSKINTNGLLSHTSTWMNFKCILLSETSLSEITAHSMIPFVWHSWKNNTDLLLPGAWWGFE